MLTRTLASSLIALFLLGGWTHANENAEQWLKYFSGNWKKERTVWNETEGEGREQKQSLSRKLVAGGKGLITEVEGDDGQAMELTHWDGYKEALVTTGINDSGVSYVLAFDKLDDTSLSGTVVGAMPNGTKGDGTVTYTKTDDDKYTVKVEINLSGGQVVKWTETNTRVKPQQRSLQTDSVNPK